MPASLQIQKMVVDLEKNIVKVYYHMNEGEISPKFTIFSRDEISGLGKSNDSSGGEKKKDDPVYIKEQQ